MIVVVVAAIILITTRTHTEQGIQLWSQVLVEYQATLPDWRIFKSGEDSIIVWENTIAWLDNHLLWLQTGDNKTIIVPASESYGQFYNPTLVQRTPIYTLTQAGITAEAETFIVLWWTRYYIQKIENDIVTLDSNALHTRQDLTYNITILSVQNPISDE